VLGLELFSQQPGRHAFFRCGSGMVLLFNPHATSQPGGMVPSHGTHGPGHLAFAIAQDEPASWRDHLARHGVEIEKEVVWPSGGCSIYFRDPAGNSVELATLQTWGLQES
jgi:catechol 2,3-dioxygenase-like lactoylglutathione lyase family enzyme